MRCGDLSLLPQVPWCTSADSPFKGCFTPGGFSALQMKGVQQNSTRSEQASSTGLWVGRRHFPNPLSPLTMCSASVTPGLGTLPFSCSSAFTTWSLFLVPFTLCVRALQSSAAPELQDIASALLEASREQQGSLALLFPLLHHWGTAKKLF